MTQAEALAWLQQHPGWHTADEVGRKMGKDQTDILRKLKKWGEIESMDRIERSHSVRYFRAPGAV